MRTSGFLKNIYSAAVRRYQYFIKVFASRLKNRSETFLDEKTFAGTASAGSEALPEDKRFFEKRFFIPPIICPKVLSPPHFPQSEPLLVQRMDHDVPQALSYRFPF